MTDRSTWGEAWQRRYYTQTSRDYDRRHVGPDPEHDIAFALMRGAIDHLGIRSVLDVGAGTGRVVLELKEKEPAVMVKAVEPVAALREVARGKGVCNADLVAGDARGLPFKDGSFDLVCAYGLLHHVARPSIAVKEMLRVAGRAIFISDSNNFGQGSWLTRMAKQTLDFFRLWPIADAVKTRGRGYTISDGDGLSYSYSVFNDYALLRRECTALHLLNTDGRHGIHPYRSATHVAVLGIKIGTAPASRS